MTELELETPRLTLRRFVPEDAPFVVTLLNDAAFLRFIGDRGVRTPDDALGWIANGPAASYARHGHGLYLVSRRDDGVPIGICGVLRRDNLPDPDLGFAFLPEFRSQGYGLAAATAALRQAREALGIGRIAAVVSPDNVASIGLLRKLGFVHEGMVRMAEDEAEIELHVNQPGVASESGEPSLAAGPIAPPRGNGR